MSDGGLLALYHLHQVDEAIQALRAQAASLDTGADELAEAKRLGEAAEGPLAAVRSLKAEQTRIETDQGTLALKARKLDAALLDGSVHSEKDRAAVAAELEAVRSKLGTIEDRLIELLETIPEAEAAAKARQEKIESLQALAGSKMREAKTHHAEIKARFDALVAKRAGIAQSVPDRLLKRYEPIRAKKGIGMGMVTDDHRCSMCGSAIPEKVRDAVRRDDLQTCEQCGRILFRLEQHA